MTQHTPGPWEPINSDGGKPAHVTSTDGRIANVHWQGGAEQSNANARLIAEAPIMYDGIKDALKCLGDPDDSWPGNVYDAWNILKATQ